MSTLESFRRWMAAPFTAPQDWLSWVCATVIVASIAWAWTRVLETVAKEL